MSKIHTHYDNLKVSRNAPDEVIRAAYKVLAQKYHPDRNQGDLDAARIMTIVNTSYRVLSDPDERWSHDRWIDEQELMAAQSEPAEKSSYRPTSPPANEPTPPPDSKPAQEPVVLKPRPWIRFWARMFDMSLALVFIIPLMIVLIPNDALDGMFYRNGSPLPAITVFLAWVFIESVLLALLGTTPGKALFNIRLRLLSGGAPDFSNSLIRSMKVWVRGLGIGFPLVSLITMSVAYFKLKKHGQTSWDREGGFSVKHGRIGPIRIFLIIVFTIVLLFAVTVLRSMDDLLMNTHSQGNPLNAKASHTANPSQKQESDFQKGLDAYNKGDYPTALQEWRPLAEQGVAAAQFNLGFMYDQGRGVPQNDAEAVKWYRKAAEQGNADAQFNLGNMYAKGRGVPQNDAEAVKWYRKAAEQGDADAEFALGLMYDQGRGVLQDYAEAVKWYRKAAEQGNADAQFNLGVRYAQGRGVLQDYTEAANWFHKAAEQGDAGAQTALGIIYAEGQGVPQDDVQAHMWVNIAASNGDEKAKELRDSLVKIMTPQQIQQAQAMASVWVQKHPK